MQKINKILLTAKNINNLAGEEIKRYKFILFLLAIIKAIDEIYSLVLLKYILEIISSRNFYKIMIVVSLLLLLSFFIDFIENYIDTTIIPKIEEELNKKLQWRIIQSVSKLNINDYDEVDKFDRIYYSLSLGPSSVIDFERNVVGLIGSFISVIGIISIIGLYEIHLLLVALVYVFFNIYFNFKETNIEYEKNKDSIRANRIINYIQRIMYIKSMVKELKIFNWMNVLEEHYLQAENKKIRLIGKYGHKLFVINVVLSLFQCLMQLVIICILVIQYINQKLNLGDFLVVFNGIMELCDNALSSLTYIPQLYKGTLYIDYLNELLLYENKKEISKIQCLKSLEIKSLKFKYDKKIIISDFDYKFEAGKKYAVIGENGTGKSTLINLISGFYDSNGSIFVDGRKVNDFGNLTQCVSAIFQSFEFNAFSIGENLLMNNEYKEKEDSIYSVLDVVGLKNRIMELPCGLDTCITSEIDENGTEFSGGELQRLAIARMLLNMRDIIVMDEPFSALDSESKYDLLKLIFRRTKGKILILITHDLSILDEFDDVIKIGN